MISVETRHRGPGNNYPPFWNKVYSLNCYLPPPPSSPARLPPPSPRSSPARFSPEGRKSQYSNLLFCCDGRGTPIGFSGSGIWRIWRPGFGILVKRENEIRDCNYERDVRFGNFTRRDSGSCSLKNRDPGGQVKSVIASGNSTFQ